MRSVPSNYGHSIREELLELFFVLLLEMTEARERVRKKLMFGNKEPDLGWVGILFFAVVTFSSLEK